jgi:hypothetical protein
MFKFAIILLAAMPLPKNGPCPSGYSSSGHYCVPQSDAGIAIPKDGPCPSGYSSSGSYCVSRPQR